jgi:hypothetical protein
MATKQTTKKKIDELNRIFSEAESCDQELFAEQRSNLLLIAGDHYTKKGSKFWNRIRDSKELSTEQKLRLTKNHIQRITKGYVNNILMHAPGVTVLPANESELQDQKAAELHLAVIEDAKNRYNTRKKIRDWCEDYIGIGEVAVKVFWDPNAGALKAFKQKIDDEGQPMVEEDGSLTPGEPVFEGAFQFERIFGFNLLRTPETQSIDDGDLLIIRKAANRQDLLNQLPEEDERRKFVQDSSEEPFLVFDGISGSYSKSDKNQVMLREFYYRPCPKYPKGYYYITTSGGILWEGELPFGIYPIEYTGFDEIQTSPRCRSIIKTLRPYQAEINRAASKIAEHQITLGDDKLLIQSGTKLTHGGVLPGVRGVSYTGMAPGILPGRSGEQYVAYMDGQIKEMYAVANYAEDAEEVNAQVDPYALLYRSIRNKKRFMTYAEKFEQFIVGVHKIFLELARHYYSDDMVIQAVGRREQVNISEFKNATALGYQIHLEPQVDDPDTVMGKTLMINQLIQYAGAQLGPDNLGKLIRLHPFANKEQVFEDLTLDYDSANNIILELDRGGNPQVQRYDTHPYLIKRLVSRTRQADFAFLSPQIQQNYQLQIQQHEQMEAQIQQEIAMAKEGFIPTGGYMVACDLYVSDPAKPNVTRRARIPYQSIEWLIKKLETQGTSLQSLETQQDGVIADITSKLKTGANQGGAGNGVQPPLMNGQASPGGMDNGSSGQFAGGPVKL